MQEKHSFDNYFGTFPTRRRDPDRLVHARRPRHRPGVHRALRDGYRPRRRLSDTAETFDAAFAGGAMNGFVTAQSSRGVSERACRWGTTTPRRSRTTGRLREDYVLFDSYFASAKGGSLQNHMYWVAGNAGTTPDPAVPTRRLRADSGDPDDLRPTRRRRACRGSSTSRTTTRRRRSERRARRPRAGRTRRRCWRSARYLDDPKKMSHLVPLDQYYKDLHDGTLPAVSYIVAAGSERDSPLRTCVTARHSCGMSSRH